MASALLNPQSHHAEAKKAAAISMRVTSLSG
jgi:hypothetical protein